MGALGGFLKKKRKTVSLRNYLSPLVGLVIQEIELRFVLFWFSGAKLSLVSVGLAPCVPNLI
jgi:hypothetical protein